VPDASLARSQSALRAAWHHVPGHLSARALDELMVAFRGLRAERITRLPSEAEQTAFSELAILILLGEKRLHGHDPQREQIARLRGALVGACGDSQYGRRLFSQSGVAFIGALLVWLALNASEERWGPTRDEIQQLISHSGVCYLPRSPYRMLELRYWLDYGSFRHCLPEIRRLVKVSGVSMPRTMERLEPAAIYELTHLVCYLTDFGRTRAAHLGPVQGHGLVKWAKHLLNLCIAAGHLDLVAELSLALECLCRCGERPAAKGWRKVEEAVARTHLRNTAPQWILSHYHAIWVCGLRSVVHGTKRLAVNRCC
jgi:uncharacterized protein DUF6895